MKSIREFAEQVVFSDRLEDKLFDPGHLLDTNPGEAIGDVPAPGRPEALVLHGPRDAMPAPNIHHLESDRDRGILLHFLANHELLATELMALVLLKFPDAPPAFRSGVLHTMREEQAHTRMYLDRMKDCGVQFGELPLSGYFWRSVAPMETPMDFVSRLSLTFEQANLDFSRYYAKVFREAGDDETAAVLGKIYLDEIGHVSHGLKWFRKWKGEDESDWDAFQRVLTFPLSPHRAKGNAAEFNQEGREIAGLQPDFIEQLKLFRQSRGRMPRVHFFNPDAEEQVAQVVQLAGSEAVSSRSKPMSQATRDLESLMMFLAPNEDVLLMRRKASPELQRGLLDIGFDLPELLDYPEDETALETHPLHARKLAGFSPWAWTPESADFVSRFMSCSRAPSSEDGEQVAHASWHDDRAKAYGKAWSADQLRGWLQASTPSWSLGPDCVGETVSTQAELAAALARLSSRGVTRALFKADLETSGRGQCRLSTEGRQAPEDQAWLAAAFDRYPLAVVEPELDREADITLQWHLGPNGPEDLKFLGWTRQLVTPGRRYAGTQIGRPFDGLAPELKRFLVADKFRRLHQLKAWLEARVVPALQALGHVGPFGVDSLVVKRDDSESEPYAFKPVVEINPRQTMGQVALRLERRITAGRSGRFAILTRSQVKRLGFNGFSEASKAWIAEFPPKISRDGKVESGVVLLADLEAKTVLWPILFVGCDHLLDA